MPEWYVMIANQQIGPVDHAKIVEFIRLKQVVPQTLVWKHGMNEWIAVGNVDVFQSYFAGTAQPTPPNQAPPHTSGHRAKQKLAGTRFCRNCAEAIDERAVVCLSCGADPVKSNNYCQECGSETHPKAIICVHCGCKLATGPGILDQIAQGGDYIDAPNPPRDPLLMALLSGCCIFWLGQILMGQTTKGIVMLLVTILSIPVGLGIVLWPIAAIDAYLIGKKLKEGKPVKQWEFF